MTATRTLILADVAATLQSHIDAQAVVNWEKAVRRFAKPVSLNGARKATASLFALPQKYEQ